MLQQPLHGPGGACGGDRRSGGGGGGRRRGRGLVELPEEGPAGKQGQAAGACFRLQRCASHDVRERLRKYAHAVARW